MASSYGHGSSAPLKEITPYAPSRDSARLYVSATAGDGTYVGKVGLDSRVTRAARPGETIQILATGFGPTNPAAPGDQIFEGEPEVMTTKSSTAVAASARAARRLCRGGTQALRSRCKALRSPLRCWAIAATAVL
jgi:hypothetical protein